MAAPIFDMSSIERYQTSINHLKKLADQIGTKSLREQIECIGLLSSLSQQISAATIDTGLIGAATVKLIGHDTTEVLNSIKQSQTNTNIRQPFQLQTMIKKCEAILNKIESAALVDQAKTSTTPADEKTSATPIQTKPKPLPQRPVIRDTAMILNKLANGMKPSVLMPQQQAGKSLIKLMYDIQSMSGLPISEIQFNFCIPGLPSNRDDIISAIEAYLKINPDPTIRSLLDSKTLTFPADSTRIHQFDESIALRADGFRQAAIMILGEGERKAVDNIFDNYCAIKGKYGDDKSKQQACYDVFIDQLKLLVKQKLTPSVESDAVISEYLRNAETIVNMKQNKSHLTVSGSLAQHDKLKGNIHVQIDEPCRKYRYLSDEQKKEWEIAIKNYHGGTSKKPEWFSRMPEFEKKMWVIRLYGDPANLAKPNDNAEMVPVVKKEGVPGLRNLMLSSFATIKYDGITDAPETSLSSKSVRSSNLVVQKKEKTVKLSEDEKNLTEKNVAQINDVYQNNGLHQQFINTWGATAPHGGHTLCQTLLRMKGGGDDYVIKHKNAAIDAVNHSSKNTIVFGSNHCIGSPNQAIHALMHIMGANTKTTDHIVKPVESFISNVVKPTLDPSNTNNSLHHQVDQLLQKAKLGKLTNHAFDAAVKQSTELSARRDNPATKPQIDSLKTVLLATSMYTHMKDKRFSFKKEYQLHMAALEEIIYQQTGNQVQSSCKSGKDREGILKCYRNAVLAFYHETGFLPPPTGHTATRDKFVKIFIELFNTHHQARLAELNAMGCEGQKALLNIIPKDILSAIKKQNPELLRSHAENSTMNDFGKSKIKADTQTYQEAKEHFSDEKPDITVKSGFTY